MRIRLIIGIIVVIAIVVGLVFGFNYLFRHAATPLGQSPSSTITINKHAFRVIVAKSDNEKEIGLSNKSSLASDQGMLFPFQTADYYAFWMKNMKFPIDIIYINNSRIVTIFHSVPSPKNTNDQLPIYKPSQPANNVLEINAGLAKKYNFKEGDAVQIQL